MKNRDIRRRVVEPHASDAAEGFVANEHHAGAASEVDRCEQNVGSIEEINRTGKAGATATNAGTDALEGRSEYDVDETEIGGAADTFAVAVCQECIRIRVAKEAVVGRVAVPVERQRPGRVKGVAEPQAIERRDGFSATEASESDLPGTCDNSHCGKNAGGEQFANDHGAELQLSVV